MNTSSARRALLCVSPVLLAAVAFAGCNLVLGIEPFHTAETGSGGAGGAGGGGGASGGGCGSEDPATALYTPAWTWSNGQASDALVAASSEGGLFLSGSLGSPVDFGGGAIDAKG